MPHTKNLLGIHKASPEWYTPEYVWGWIEYIFDCDRIEIFDPCPIGGTGGLDLDWSKHKLIYVNPPSPASKWASRTISYMGQKQPCLLYLSFSESVIWQNPALLTCPTVLIRKRIPFISNAIRSIDCSIIRKPPLIQPLPRNKKLKDMLKSNPSNYNALHLINGDYEQLNRFKRIGRIAGTVIQSNILS